MSSRANAVASAHERRCRYASKRCENPRALKRNGELHRFCEYHRERANLNQKRNDQKKKDVPRKEETEAMDAMLDDDEQEVQRHDQDKDDEREKPRDDESKGSVPDADDNDDNKPRSGSLDMDDNEIEEIHTLVVAEQLQDELTETDPAQRIEP